MVMPGSTFSAGNAYSTDSYRYGFNGKEKDLETTETSTYDYGFRIYNPGLGRFLSVDPLTQKFAFYSPYQFAGNKPIRCIDIDGLEPISKIEDWKNTKGYYNYGNFFNDNSSENQQFELVENYFIYSRESSKNQSREYFYYKVGEDMYHKFDPNNVEKQKPILVKFNGQNTLQISKEVVHHRPDPTFQNSCSDWWYNQKFGYSLSGNLGVETHYGRDGDGVEAVESLEIGGLLGAASAYREFGSQTAKLLGDDFKHEVYQFTKWKELKEMLERQDNMADFVSVMADTYETFDKHKQNNKKLQPANGNSMKLNLKSVSLEYKNVKVGSTFFDKMHPELGTRRKLSDTTAQITPAGTKAKDTIDKMY
jgi:RHS repeat-associated protein